MDEKQNPPPYAEHPNGPQGYDGHHGQQQQPYPGQQQQPYPGQQQQPYPGQQQQPYPGQQQAFQGPQQGYPGQPAQSVVVVTHQANAGGQPATSYLGFAIFTCLCCCWPIGIAAIIFAVRTNDENGRGNFAAAQSSSKIALWCSVAALIIGSIFLIIVIALSATGNFYVKSSYNYYG